MQYDGLPANRPARIVAVYWVIVFAVVAACVTIRQIDPGFMARLRLLGFDLLQQALPRASDPSYPVRVVDIDEASIRAFGKWPWPRNLLAGLVHSVFRHGARVVVFDMVLPEPSDGPLDRLPEALRTSPDLAPLVEKLRQLEAPDDAFTKAIAQHPTVLGVIGTSRPGAVPKAKASFALIGGSILNFVPGFAGGSANLSAFEQSAAGTGALNWLPDHDQILRRIPLVVRIAGEPYPSLAVEAVRVFQDTKTLRVRSAADGGFVGNRGITSVAIGDTIIPTVRDGQLWHSFSHRDPKRTISAADVLQNATSAYGLDGRIVVVGTSAPGLLDLRATPLNPVISGVEINAEAIEQLLTKRLLVRPDYDAGMEIVVAAAAALLLCQMIYLWGARLAALIGFACVCAFSGGALFAFSHGLLLDAVFPIFTTSAAYIVGTGYLYYEAESERNRGRQALQRIAQEMEAAAQIQRTFLPKEALTGPHLDRFDIHALMKPAKAVGGDFYDYFFIGDAKLGFAVGDVSGKGVPAALFMSVSRTVLRTVAFEAEAPGLVLSKVNAILARENSEGMFVTIFYAVLDLATGEIAFSSAGHDDGVLLTATGTCEQLGHMGPAIGLIDTAEFPTITRVLAPGDTMVLLTDGITEAFDATGRVFGAERVLQSVTRRNYSNASDLVQSLTQEVASFAGNEEQSDDITCIALRFKG
jgi:serine phosphatase RsbU (regulator of sigma subunit)/CHASE2 domain-containing sensor protein